MVITVQIIGSQIACAEGIKDSWRDMADWARGQLTNRFGDAVRVEYYDLFDPNCPPLPDGAQLPLVSINDEVITSGEKLRIPTIRRHIEALLDRA